MAGVSSEMSLAASFFSVSLPEVTAGSLSCVKLLLNSSEAVYSRTEV